MKRSKVFGHGCLQWLLIVGIACVVATAIPGALAWADKKRQVFLFDIHPQEITEALKEVAMQTGHQLLFSAEQTDLLASQPLMGSYSIEEALSLLLQGTGLSFEITARGVIVIKKSLPIVGKGEKEMRTKKKVIYGLVGSLLGLSASHSALGEMEGSVGTRLEEIVVTAQKRSESLQEVPISASALSGEAMTTRGINDIRDLASGLVPSLRIDSAFGNTNPKLSLRGVGSTSYTQNTESSIAIYLDEFVLNPQSAKLGQMFDLERVEVLRGPQGTLYGKNSTGGAINFISRRPDGDYAFDMSATVARYGEYSFEIAGEAPVTESLSFRAAIKRRSRDGYGFNRLTGDDVFDIDDLAGRLGVRFQNDSVDAYIKVFGDRARGEGYYMQGLGINFDLSPRPSGDNPITGYAPPGNIDVVDSNRQINDVDNYGASANVDIVLDGMIFTSITGYLNSETHILSDSDASPFDLLTADIRAPAEELSQEFRITSDTNSRLSWIAGLSMFYQTLKVSEATSFSAVGIPSIDSYFHEKSTSLAGFFDATLELPKGVSLFSGVRLTTDKKTFDTSSRVSFVGPYDLKLKKRWTEPTYRAGVHKKFDNDLMLWGSYNRGYRAGGFDGGTIVDLSQFETFDPEFVDSYEVGLKTSFFDQRLRFSVNAYYTIVKSQQLPVLREEAALCCSIVNAGRSRIYGLELEGDALFSDNFNLQFQGSVADGKYTDFVSGENDYSGMKVSNLPRYEFRLSSEYRIPVTQGDIFVAPEVVFVGKARRGTDFDPFGRDVVNSYELVNGQVGYRTSDGRMSTFLFVKNLTNKRYLTDYLNVGDFGLTQLFYAEPRTWGITVAVNF